MRQVGRCGRSGDAAGRAMRQAGRGWRGEQMQRTVRRAAVIGTGTIGMSWAASFLARGIEVAAWDPAPDAEARLRQFVETVWPVLARLAMLAASPPQHLMK